MATSPRIRLARRDRRSQLLAAAQRVFAAHGYHAAAMDDIAERAGVTKPVLYQHFPGKRDLYLAVVDQRCTELADAVREALAGPPGVPVEDVPGEELVSATIAAVFAFVDRQDAASRLVFESDLRSDPAVRARLEQLDDECATAVADVVQADAGLPRARAEVLAVALVGSAQVAARSWVASGRALPREDAAALITQLVWRGLRGFPRSAARGA